MIKKIAIQLILDELRAAETKHSKLPSDYIRAAAEMDKKSGEAMQAALDCHYRSGSVDKLLTKLIQTGAMAVWALSMFPLEAKNKR